MLVRPPCRGLLVLRLAILDRRTTGIPKITAMRTVLSKAPMSTDSDSEVIYIYQFRDLGTVGLWGTKR